MRASSGERSLPQETLLKKQAAVTHKKRGQACGYPVSVCIKPLISLKNCDLLKNRHRWRFSGFSSGHSTGTSARCPRRMHSLAHILSDSACRHFSPNHRESRSVLLRNNQGVPYPFYIDTLRGEAFLRKPTRQS
jgi:hypothetical protein